MENESPSSIRSRGRIKPYQLRQIQLSQLMEKLFQWIHNFCLRDSCLLGDLYDDPVEIFKYELCSYPSALFESSILLRAAKKPPLADAIWALGERSANNNLLNGTEIYVLDGGSLLQRLLSPKRTSFDTICDIYIDHVKTKYPKSIVVFDGYDCEPSTKDNTRLRRSKGNIGAEVHFKGSVFLQSIKEEFLANTTNKQKFIHMLSHKFQQHGCETLQVAGDADLLIVQTAVKCPEHSQAVVIGEDTDLLVLLCMHAEMDNEDIIFQPETKQKSAKFRIWDIKKTKKVIGLEKCCLLSVVHAIPGCDTTS